MKKQKESDISPEPVDRCEQCANCSRPRSEHGTWIPQCPPGWGVNTKSRFKPSGRTFIPRPYIED